MKTSLKSISIPMPCNQRWAEMAPVNGGRHCENCCKTVVDFTMMTDVEIIASLSISGGICGRFNTNQISNVNTLLGKHSLLKLSKKKISIAALIAVMLSPVKVTAQTKSQLLASRMAAKKNLTDTLKRRSGSDKIECKSLSVKQIDPNANLPKYDTVSKGLQMSESFHGIVGGVTIKRPWTYYFFQWMKNVVVWPVKQLIGN